MGTPSEEFRFSRRPPSGNDNGGWSIVRARPKGDLKVVSLADDFFGIEVHFWNGRTTPCRTLDCPACLAGMLSRWVGYLPGLSVPKWSPVIVEFTGSAAADLDAHRDRFGSLRGVNLRLYRPTEKPNGRVRVEECGLYKEPSRLPASPAVWPIVAKIFRVNPLLFTEGDNDASGPIDPPNILSATRLVPGDTLKQPCESKKIAALPGQLSFIEEPSKNGDES